MKSDSTQITIWMDKDKRLHSKRPQLIKALIKRQNVSIKAAKLQVETRQMIKGSSQGGANMVIVGREWV